MAILFAGLLVGCGADPPGAELEPTDPIDAIVEATGAYPVVGLAEPHLSQDFHRLLADLLPELRGRVDDIVVEFGNAHYQDLADRFILELEPVAFEELAQRGGPRQDPDRRRA